MFYCNFLFLVGLISQGDVFLKKKKTEIVKEWILRRDEVESKTGKSGERENLIWDVMDKRRMKRKEKNSLRRFNNQMYAPMLSSLRYRVSEKVLALL